MCTWQQSPGTAFPRRHPSAAGGCRRRARPVVFPAPAGPLRRPGHAQGSDRRPDRADDARTAARPGRVQRGPRGAQRKKTPKTRLKPRFAEALQYAIDAHDLQVRKDTDVTYVAHLLDVASLVLDHGGDEDEAIAALLHDTLEDCGRHHEAAIRAAFGERVVGIVLGLTDGTKEDKARPATDEEKRADWRRRKEVYLDALAHHDDRVLLVSCCDKLHNARAIVSDLHVIGGDVFKRFTGGPNGTLWYYEALAAVFAGRQVAPAAELRRAVDEMARRSRDAASARHAL